MKVREPAVAGAFYPGTPEKLKNFISQLDDRERKNYDATLSGVHILGGVVPHAGYVYSGSEAVHFFSLLPEKQKDFETVVLLNPNHRGNGPAYATDTHDAWKTPLGEYEIDTDFKKLINIQENESAHRLEHSSEVMLPFLQYYLPDPVKIFPISIMKQTPEIAREISSLIRRAAQELHRKILVIASSDFCHFLNADIGYALDEEVLEAIRNLDPDAVYRKIIDKNITVCGYGPIMTLMDYALHISKDTKVRILARGNSAKSKSMERVVDYVSILFYTD